MPRSPDESRPIWREEAFEASWRWAEPQAECQVCVVGAGISGLTTAYLLQKNGYQVQVLDAYGPAAGETGRTTAHLTAVLDDRFVELERLFGLEGALLAADSHRMAIDRIEAIVAQEAIECDLERLDGYLVCTDPAKRRQLAAEGEAATRAGFTDLESLGSMRTPEILIDGPALRFPRQATFHIGKYMRGLAHAFTRRGGRLVPGARVVAVHGGRNAHVDLASGGEVGAEHVVVATNTPFNDRVRMHTKQAAYRTYVVGFEISKNGYPPFLLWDLEDPYHYVRVVRGFDRDALIVGGEDHKTGQADDAGERYRRLESWARGRFRELGPARYRWSGQVMEPIDGLGFIGRNPLDEQNVYICTGDSGNGMTHGTLAGMLIGDLIAGRANAWEKLYDPARKTLRAAPSFVEENANVVGHLVKDWIRGSEVHDRTDILRGEGAIVRDGGALIAAYRDADGTLRECSAVCTHLGCIVQWNGGERSWDCPCHGSRFATDGSILNGPARLPLKQLPPGEPIPLGRTEPVAEPLKPPPIA